MNQLMQIGAMSVSLGQGHRVLEGIHMSVGAGECHVIMGPNGSGKTSLMHTIMGLPPYTIEGGSLQFQGQDIHSLSVEERSLMGIFLSFQNPVAIPGVSNLAFYKAMMQQKRAHEGKPPLDGAALMSLVREAYARSDLPDVFLRRDFNHDFSGGERKRNELVQLLLLQPKLVLLDELDSGLDIDAMKRCADLIAEERARGMAVVVVSHYHSFIQRLEPDAVHVLYQGKKVAEGTGELLDSVEREGYQLWLKG